MPSLERVGIRSMQGLVEVGRQAGRPNWGGVCKRSLQGAWWRVEEDEAIGRVVEGLAPGASKGLWLRGEEEVDAISRVAGVYLLVYNLFSLDCVSRLLQTF